MKKITFIIILFLSKTLFAQEFYNRIDIKSENFPNELQKVDYWLSSKIESFFYSGMISEQRYFKIVSNSTKNTSISIPSIGVTFSLDMEYNKTRKRFQSKDLKFYKELKSKRISRYRDNFDFKKLIEPKYYFEYFLDFYSFGDYELLSIGYVDVEETQIKNFIKRLNKYYKTNFNIDDLSKYRYTETLDEYKKRSDLKFNLHCYEQPPRGERDRIERLIELINNELSINDPIEQIIFNTYIHNTNINSATENLEEFLNKLFGSQEYKKNINLTLIQEYTFYDFPVKMNFNDKTVKIFGKKNVSGLLIDRNTYFDINKASFRIIPNNENSNFEMIFNGDFISGNKDLNNFKKIIISLTAQKVKIEIINQQNKIFEITNRIHKL